MATVKKTTSRKTSAAKKTAPARSRARVSVRKAAPKAVAAPVAAAKKDSVAPGIYLGFGILFGYLLAKAGITDPENIRNMFLIFMKQYRDFHLYGVIGILVLVMVVGVFLLQRFQGKSLLGKEALVWKPKAFEGERLIGAAFFGFGWALTGACPASAVAQLGEGKFSVLAIIAGILVGTWAYRAWAEKK